MTRNIIAAFLLLAILTACGDSKKTKVSILTDKKVKLQELKKEQKSLNDEITKLETEIAKLDTTSTGQPKLVAVETLGAGNFTHFVDLEGKVDATNISYVAPPNGQGGLVKALYVRQGQAVRKGQVLARLDDQMIRQQIEPLRAQLSMAEDTYKRTKALYDQGIGTYQQLLTVQTQVETLKRQIGVLQRQATLMTVTAPSSGIADQVNVRVGENFIGVYPGNPPMPQIRIVNTGSLKIVAQIPEGYLGRIGVGTPIQVVLPNAGNRIINTKISVTGKTIDPTSRSYYIEAPIPSDPSFKPNQVAIVKVQDYATGNAITIPLSTLQNDESGKFVMVAMKEGNKMIARKRKVVVGELYGDRLEVKSGLQAGDMLITGGFQNLYEGQPIMTGGI
jgi:membrane fusion protein, multidrug efflux system